MLIPPGYGFRKKKKPEKYSVLKQELINLSKRISQTDNRLSEITEEFFEADGTCCPSCWSEEYRNLEIKQTRRYQRIKQIQNKLGMHKQKD